MHFTFWPMKDILRKLWPNNRLLLVHKITSNNCRSRLLVEFIHTQTLLNFILPYHLIPKIIPEPTSWSPHHQYILHGCRSLEENFSTTPIPVGGEVNIFVILITKELLIWQFLVLFKNQKPQYKQLIFIKFKLHISSFSNNLYFTTTENIFFLTLISKNIFKGKIKTPKKP